jgi:hypothetical protein
VVPCVGVTQIRGIVACLHSRFKLNADGGAVLKKLLLIALLVSTFLLGCQANQPETFAGEVGGLSVELAYPASWAIDAQPDTVYLASDEGILGEETAVTAGGRLRISTLSTSTLATDNYALLMQNEILAIQEVLSAQIIGDDFETVDINGNEAFTVELSSLTTPVVYRFVMMPTETNIALILAEYVPEEDGAQSTAIDQIVNSLVANSITQ